MTWATRFRIREYVRESLWVVPSLGAIIGVRGAAVLISIDSHLKVPSQWAYSPVAFRRCLAGLRNSTWGPEALDIVSR
jgi:hypothetical protein